MAAPQSYTSTGDATVPAHEYVDQGHTVSIGTLTSGVGGTDDNYATNRDTSANLYFEITNLVALLTRAAPSGLGMPPRAILAQIRDICTEMLRQTVA